MISTALYFITRLAALAVLTFLFVVLYDHGPQDYAASVQKEFGRLMEAIPQSGGSDSGKKSSESGT